jgi:DNA-directed RNA polymerase subunit L
LDKALVSAAKKLMKSESDLHKFETLDKWRLFSKNEFGEPNSFRFTIDSECRVSPMDIFEFARRILITKLENLINVIQWDRSPDANMMLLYVRGEDHTIGNMLQVSIFNHFVRKKDRVEYVGYFQPHPLEQHIMFKIRFVRFVQDGVDLDQFINECISNTISDIKSISPHIV